MQKFDLVVIGAGPGGYVGAIRAAQLGLRVALVEKGEIGGTCLNRGCIPTKALLHTAQLYREAVHSFADIGLHCEGLAYDTQKMYDRKNEVVQSLRGGVTTLLQANGVELFCGAGYISQPGQVEVRGDEPVLLHCKNILVATGSAAALPPIEGLDLPGVVTSDDLLREAKIYPRLAIIGAGVIGVEFATLYAALGSEVTLLEAQPRALPEMGREVATSAAMQLKKAGAVLHTGAAVSSVVQSDTGLRCHFAAKGQQQSVEADAVLVATGRRPVLEGLFAPQAQPQTERGFVVVDAHFATSIPGLYAVGDVIPTMQLAHTASAEAKAAVEHIAGVGGATPRIVPACVYTSPEIAVAGLTEEKAAAEGIKIKTAKFLMGANGRTLIETGERSFIKLLAEEETGRLVGAELVCPRATDLIATLVLAMEKGMRAEELDSVIYAHPTFAEGIGEAAAIFGDGAIHASPKRRQ